MSGKTDQIKGRIKEAAGVLTDNDGLKRKGKLDQVVGKVKETAEKAVDKMKDALTSNRIKPVSAISRKLQFFSSSWSSVGQQSFPAQRMVGPF